jgi:hypothetical protein
MSGLLTRLLGVEGESSVNFCGDLAGHNLEDLRTELNEESVESGVDLFVDIFALTVLSVSFLLNMWMLLRVPCRTQRLRRSASHTRASWMRRG